MDYYEYADCRQREFAYGVVDQFLYGDTGDDAIVTLSGDAGAGKTRTLAYLRNLMDSLGIVDCMAVSTTTNAAAGVIGANASTVYSLLGINTGPLLTARDLASFKRIYSQRHSSTLTAVAAFAKRAGEVVDKARAMNKHRCKTFKARCAVCLNMFRRAVSTSSSAPIIAGLGVSLLVIDEYGLLNAVDVEKILWVCRQLRAVEDAGTLLILCGSVSQLSAPNSAPIWRDTSTFRKRHVGGLYLSANFRQRKDPVYGDSLTCMQFNLITRECHDIVNSRILPVGDLETDVTTLRIYNNNSGRDAHNKKCMEGKDIVDLAPHIVTPNAKARRAFIDCIKDRYRLVFSDGVEHKVYVGATVHVLRSASIPAALTGRGVVTHAASHVEVRLAEGTTVRVESETLTDRAHPYCRATFYPVVPSFAINTFTAQGSTIETPVLYVPPPKNYFMSKILPSAYVACSRVTKRDDLSVAWNTFANKTGHAPFFTVAQLQFKKTMELGYGVDAP